MSKRWTTLLSLATGVVPVERETVTESMLSTPPEVVSSAGVAFDSHGHLYIVDAFNHRVQKFAVE